MSSTSVSVTANGGFDETASPGRKVGMDRGKSAVESSNGQTNSKTALKYRHVAAVHSKPRHSCLSHDSEHSPGFLGFRNLMVIVLSMAFTSN